MPKIAYLFPGQGAQYVGIGADLYAEFSVVRDTYDEASEAVGYDIAALSQRGVGGDINRTRFTQPVLLAHSVACLRAFNARTDDEMSACMAGGHSLGEYCALVAAGALSFAAALRLVQKRGALMGEFGRGEMEALMVDFDAASALAARHHCAVAACNLPMQNVVGGRAEDLDSLIKDMQIRHPKKRSARLKTEGAFHTFYMVEAAIKFRDELAQTEFAAPKFPVLSNFTGGFHDDDCDALKSRLFLQLINPVLWHRNLLQLAEASNHLIEFGGGLGKGETAADKRPNLETIVKKTYGRDDAPEYSAVINLQTLEETVMKFV